MKTSGWCFCFALVLLLSGHAFADGGWFPLGSGTDNYVSCLTSFNGHLIAGGQFIHAGGGPANRVAEWAGAWGALGSGFDDGFVSTLTEFHTDLYAGGHFYHAGGMPVNHIARWNGTAWTALGTGMSPAWGGVNASIVFHDKLIVGGNFANAGGVAANNIAQWDGDTWSAFAGGMNGPVHALIISGGDLIAAGTFTSAGGVAATGIARWNGSHWYPLGSGVMGIYVLTVYDGKLIAGGDFTSAGGAPGDYIAQWNGSSWSELGGGMNGMVFALTVLDGDLIAGGLFYYAGTEFAREIAGWDGSEWFALSDGMDDAATVQCLYAFDHSLFTGGHFTGAKYVPANNIAMWGYPGACCRADDDCLIVAEAQCEWLGGFFIGAGVSCDPNPCQPQIGACCDPAGNCMMSTAMECPGSWLGPDFSCDPNPCMPLSVDPGSRVASSRPLRVSSPSTGQVRVQYQLSTPSRVTLDILDLSGRRVRRLLDESQAAGDGVVTWDGRNDAGNELYSGIYITRLETAAGVSTEKVVLAK